MLNEIDDQAKALFNEKITITKIIVRDMPEGGKHSRKMVRSSQLTLRTKATRGNHLTLRQESEHDQGYQGYSRQYCPYT